MIQNGFFAKVIKTDKIKVNESSYDLPPHKGAYKEYKVADYYCPDDWSKDGVFIPVKEGDPLWFDFRGNDECAILCSVQRFNPVADKPADLEAGLSKDPIQNYLKMPEQQWLDGYAREGKVYQFVVTKAGIGLAVNEYVLPKYMQDSHAIGFAFFTPKNPKPKVTVQHVSPYFGNHPWKSCCYGGQSISNSGTAYSSGGWTLSSKSTPINAPRAMGRMLRAKKGLATNGEAILFNATSIDVSCPDNSNFQAEEECVANLSTRDILNEQAVDLSSLEQASMGAGGRIRQTIVTDDNSTDYYHTERSALLVIYFALPEMFDVIMTKGKRQDHTKKDKYKKSGEIGGIAVPLID